MNSAYSSKILNFIDCDRPYFNPSTPQKFAVAGDYFCDLAEVLNYSSDRWLRNWLNDRYGENEYCEVPYDWSDWLASRTQESVSVKFLDKYSSQIEVKHDYPETRATWSKYVDLEVDDRPNLASTIAIANPEDLKSWSQQIETVMRGKQSLSFIQLQKLVDLEPVETLLSVLLGEQFLILNVDENDFYSDFVVEFRSN